MHKWQKYCFKCGEPPPLSTPRTSRNSGRKVKRTVMPGLSFGKACVWLGLILLGAISAAVFIRIEKNRENKSPSAQETALKPSTDPSRGKRTEPEGQPFDPSIEAVPPNFEGNDPYKLSIRLDWLKHGMQKGEFETTGEYKKRIEVLKAQPLVSLLNINSLFAFVPRNIHARYDANRQLLTAWYGSDSDRITLAPKSQYTISRINERVVKRTTETGANAHAAAKKIEKLELESYSIRFYNAAYFPLRGYGIDKDHATPARVVEGGVFATDISMDAAAAIKAKKNIRAILVCRLVEPYYSKSFNRVRPTIADPVDVVETIHTIHSELIELWFYDAESGRIYSKLKPQDRIQRPLLYAPRDLYNPLRDYTRGRG